jgi:DNA polymerase/3'-5' exonuclease PolX
MSTGEDVNVSKVAEQRARVKRALADMALAYEIVGDGWRAKAFRRADRLIDAVERKGSTTGNGTGSRYVVLLERPEEAPGIGPSIASFIQSLSRANNNDEINSIVAKKTSSFVDAKRLDAYRLLIGVLGVGHTLALHLINHDGVTNLEQLRKHAVAVGNTLIQNGIKHYKDLNSKMPRDTAKDAVRKLREAVTCIFPGLDETAIIPLGSYRRGNSEVGDIDLLVNERVDLGRLAAALPRVLGEKAYVSTVTKGKRRHSFLFRHKKRVMRVDIFAMHDPKERPTFILHATGSADHNEFLRQVAKSKGMLLNEYGLFDITTRRRKPRVKEESDVYRVLGIPYVPPHERRG